MIIYNYWPQRVGGAEVQCRQLARELKKKGLDISVVTARLSFADSKSEMDAGVKIYRVATLQPLVEFLLSVRKRCLWPRRKRSIPGVKNNGLAEFQRNSTATLLVERSLQWVNFLMFMVTCAYVVFKNRLRFNIIHVHTTESLAGFAVLLGRFIKVPVLCKEASTPAFLETKHSLPFSKTLDKLRFNAHFIAMTEYVKKQMIERGIQDKRIYLIPNGVHIPEVTASLEGNKRVLWVGNISQGIQTKGLDVLLDAWGEVIKKIPKGKLLLVGGGEPTILTDQIERKRLNDYVRLVGYKTDVAQYYLDADLVVIPSRREGMSNVLLEALSYGVPVVASDIPANAAVFKDEECGFLVPVGDSKTFAARIIEILTDDQLRSQLGKNAQKIATNTYSYDVITESVIDCYNQIHDSYMKI